MTERPAATRIILARHGEACYPADGAGDPGGTLTELGRSQARALAERLSDDGVVAVVSSELSRAKETAHLVAERLRLPVQARDGLQEYRLGEGVRAAEELAAVFLSWLDGDLSARIPGGEDGDQIARRVLGVLDDLAVRHSGRTVLVVSHGGAIIATLGRIAPGRSSVLPDGRRELRVQDLPGGRSFVLEHGADGWRLG